MSGPNDDHQPEKPTPLVSGSIPLLITDAQRKEADKAAEENERRTTENAYKDRQLTISERQLDISHQQLAVNRRISTYTAVLAVLGLLGTGASVIASYAAKKSADAAEAAAKAASNTLAHMQTNDASTASQADQVIGNLNWNARAVQESLNEARLGNEKSGQRAQEALQASIENMHLDQRAWVGVIEVTPAEFTVGDVKVYIKEGSVSTIGVIITNSGKTPALFVSRVALYGMPREVPFRPIYLPSFDVNSLSLLSPNVKAILRSRIPSTDQATKEQIGLLASGAITLYLYGILGYRDVFDASHYTTFCLYLDRTLTVFNGCSVYNRGD